jgi:hypothetical protein
MEEKEKKKPTRTKMGVWIDPKTHCKNEGRPGRMWEKEKG